MHVHHMRAWRTVRLIGEGQAGGVDVKGLVKVRNTALQLAKIADLRPR